MPDLTTQEAKSLRNLEAVIEKGQKTFIDVGNALAQIQADKLYRGKYATFEAYCQERWGFARRTAYQLIDASKVVENVRNCAQIDPPKNEAQARELAKLPPEQQGEAWQTVVEECEAAGKPVTAKATEEVVERFLEPDAVRGPSDEFELETYEDPKPEGPDAVIERAKNLPQFSCAMNFARVAINELAQIPRNDPEREEAFTKVEKWIQSQRRK